MVASAILNHPLLGKSAKTEIYYLTEEGSDLLHSIAPQANYHARPGLPSRSRIYHELCVTSVRLDLQSTNNVFSYEPETEIRSQQLKELNRIGKEQTNLKIIENQNWGCGDFRALVVDPHSGKRSQVEVEITIRARQKEITAKPDRITDYYAATLHRCFLIEASQGKFAKIIPDVRIPLTENELATGRSKPSSIRATISQNRIDRVSAAFEKMGGIGTPGSIAKIAGLKPSTVSEVLFMLAEKGETTYCDGFPPTGKDIGRNLRLYLSKGYTIHSVFDFWRLLTACEVISAEA